MFVDTDISQNVNINHEPVCLVAQLCPTLCDLMDCSLPGFSVHGIPRPECWSGLPFPSPGDLPDPEIQPGSPTLWGDSLPLCHQGSPWIGAGEGTKEVERV